MSAYGDNEVTGSKVEPEWDDDKEPAKTSLCCLQGCLAASAVGFSFFVALPTGIILVVLSVNSDDTALLAVGCVLISLPVLMLIVVIILCLNQKRLCCNTRRKKKSTQPVTGTTQHVNTGTTQHVNTGTTQHVNTGTTQHVSTTTSSGESPV